MSSEKKRIRLILVSNHTRCFPTKANHLITMIANYDGKGSVEDFPRFRAARLASLSSHEFLGFLSTAVIDNASIYE